jgi:D-lactate dehydrogenase
MKIAFFDTKSYDKEFFQAANKNFGYEIKFFESHLTQDTAILAKGCPVVCPFVNDRLDAPLINALYQFDVELIALRSAGYNNVDLKAAQGKLHVVRVPKYSPYAVAEHAVGMMLTLNRKFHRAYNRTRDNNFSITGLLGFDMHGKTAGVIGIGQIGKVVVEILKGFGMKVLTYDVVPGLGTSDLDTIYRESDIITLHCPLTQGNKHMIDEKALSKMKKGVMLINTGRGGLIDTKALIENLKNQKIGAAGLDVYEEESAYFYEDFSFSFIQDDVLARLLSFPNVLITSHQAFFTQEALHNIAQTTLENIREFDTKQPLKNEVHV